MRFFEGRKWNYVFLFNFARKSFIYFSFSVSMKSLSLLVSSLLLGFLTVSAEETGETQTMPVSRELPDLSTVDSPYAPSAGSRTYALAVPGVETFQPTIKFGGYIVGKYQATDQKSAPASTFDLRLMRLYAQGFVARDFYYRFQFEVNRSPGTDRGPRVLDAYIDWQRYEGFRIRLGQFKRAFAFENPMSPLSIGFGSFAQSTIRLQSLNDRIGEHRSSGRDVGVQFYGDLFKFGPTRHHFLHYQLGVYNGQGINYVDVNNHKDVIAGLWISPVKDLAIGVFGWEGRYQRTVTDAQGKSVRQIANRHRYALGLKYESAWTVRAEYVHSRGGTLTQPSSNHSDGWYAVVGVPVPKVKGLKIYGRWDAYRDQADHWDDLKTNWSVAANYWLNKNLLFQLNLTHTHDRAQRVGAHYNTVDAQVAARF